MPKSDDDKAPITSLISLSWQPPQRGDWDGFVVDYSPFEFENAVSTPAPPIELPKNALDLNVSLFLEVVNIPRTRLSGCFVLSNSFGLSRYQINWLQKICIGRNLFQ